MKKVAMTVLGVVSIAASANAEGTCQTNLNTWRSLLPKRLMGLAISTLLITFIAAAAHADDVLTLGTVVVPKTIAVVISTYTFNSSMILNSIGFVSTSGTNFAVYRYSINGETYKDVDRLSVDLASAVNDVRWFSLATPITLNANDVVRVSTARTVISATPKVRMLGYTAVPGFDITVVGNDQDYGAFTNSNLRVSALPPSASVAPEPGTLALAVTGGCALVGMYIRRRKTA
jgi:hypothetical protein